MSKKSKQLARTDPAAQRLAAQTTVFAQTYSGPLPHPEDLERYDVIVPGMAERLLVKFEQQADHRMALERRVIEGDVKRANWGLVFALLFGVAVMVASVALILTGHEGPGAVLFITECLTYGSIFVYGTEVRRRERNRKARGQ